MTFAEAIDVILKQPGTAVHRKAWTSNKYLAIYGDVLVIGCGEVNVLFNYDLELFNYDLEANDWEVIEDDIC